MALFDSLIQKYRTQRTRAALNTLSDRQLDDIGLTRGDVADNRALYAASKPTGMHGII